ncbi:MAG: hypothetical protein J7K88_12200 [Candidatus Fermentibacteraceae bacterium]|nr:hypothetical protein [Candidatus Fermentibacteraceae bacterium]
MKYLSLVLIIVSLGIADNDATNDTCYTNDWIVSSLFFTDNFGSTWTTFTNPAGTSGRGMDFNGNIYWSYKDVSDAYHLTEFSFSITSLSRSSWGSIKSSF